MNGKNPLKENLGSFYDELSDFFIEIYENYRKKEYFKIVITSGHCQKVLDLWLKSDDPDVPDEVKNFFKKNSLSQEEFENSIPSIIEKYESNHILPLVIRIDSLLFHGRKINRCVLDYEKAFLRRVSLSEDQDFLQDRLVHLTKIHIFAGLTDNLSMLSRYRRLSKVKMLIDKVPFYSLQIKLMNALGENIVGKKDEIDKDLVDAVDEVISQIGYETEREAVLLCKSGILMSDEGYAKWSLEISLNEFFMRCVREYPNLSIDDMDIVKAMLSLREKQGYISLMVDENNEVSIRASEQALLIKPMKYAIFIPLLKELQRRVRESQLDLKSELSRMLNNLPPEKQFCTLEEIYSFLSNLSNIGRGIEDFDVDFNLIFNNSDSYKEAVSKSSYYLREYKKI